MKVRRHYNRYDFEYEFFDEQSDMTFMVQHSQTLEYGQEEIDLFEKSLSEAKVEVQQMIDGYEASQRETMETGEELNLEFEVDGIRPPAPLKLDIPEYDYANGHTYDRT